MKTSFYFVLWILIYPILGLFNNSFINNNAFIVALAVVWGISWLLNRVMPKNLAYERASQITPILEDVYTCNVASFKKRLSKATTIEIVRAVYFIVTTVVIALAILKAGINDLMALLIFGFFTFGAISRSITLLVAKSKLKSNPTPEQCMEIVDETYKLDYASYYEAHNGVSYHDMLPPKPRCFKTIKVFSIVIAAIASLLGLLHITLGIIIMLCQTSLEAGAIASMYFLYGFLAAYFGVKDLVSCIYKNNSSSDKEIQTR